MSTSSSGTTSERRDDGGPAYPVQDMIEEGKILCHRGMSLRDYFAAKAMQAVYANPEAHAELVGISRDRDVRPSAVFAEEAYSIADSMLLARQAVMP